VLSWEERIYFSPITKLGLATASRVAIAMLRPSFLMLSSFPSTEFTLQNTVFMLEIPTCSAFYIIGHVSRWKSELASSKNMFCRSAHLCLCVWYRNGSILTLILIGKASMPITCSVNFSLYLSEADFESSCSTNFLK
jgi:hypothetical protein